MTEIEKLVSLFVAGDRAGIKYCAQQKRCSTCEAERFGIHCLQYLTAKFLISQNVSIGERSDDDAD